MEQLSVPATGTVHVDANAFIYRVERIEPYLTASAPLWDSAVSNPCGRATPPWWLCSALSCWVLSAGAAS